MIYRVQSFTYHKSKKNVKDVSLRLDLKLPRNDKCLMSPGNSFHRRTHKRQSLQKSSTETQVHLLTTDWITFIGQAITRIFRFLATDIFIGNT